MFVLVLFYLEEFDGFVVVVVVDGVLVKVLVLCVYVDEELVSEVLQDLYVVYFENEQVEQVLLDISFGIVIIIVGWIEVCIDLWDLVIEFGVEDFVDFVVYECKVVLLYEVEF